MNRAAAVARSPALSEAIRLARPIEPVLKWNEVSASNSCCVTGTFSAAVTPASYFAMSFRNSAIHSSTGLSAVTVTGSTPPAALVWPTPTVQTPTESFSAA